MKPSPLPPNSTIGILGSGQLGRLLTLAAHQLGYRVYIFSPERGSPAGQVADLEIVAAYHNLEAVRQFASRVDVVTYEFENVPAKTAEVAAQQTPLFPGGWVLHTTQNRLREKWFLEQHNLPTVPFVAIHSLADLQAAVSWLGFPVVLKTAESGYDGKGQYFIRQADEVEPAYAAIGQQDAVLELFLDFDRELSVVAVRGQDGRIEHFGVIQNSHHQHILDISLAPAPILDEVRGEAVALARRTLTALDVVGVCCVEMFLSKEGQLFINEVAPRVHNSGHLTLEACAVSQFEQHIRAICGLPLSEAVYRSPAAMANLLGDLWQAGEPNWSVLHHIPGLTVHRYGKREARPGRKMGHITALAETAELAAKQVKQARDLLQGKA